MSLSLDPQIRLNLKYHLASTHDFIKQQIPLMLGNEDQLKTAVKISSNADIFLCFNEIDGYPNCSPELPKRNYLVACIKSDFNGIQVCAFYNLQQMQAFYKQQSSNLGNISWNVLVIPEELEAELLAEIEAEKQAKLEAEKQAKLEAEKPQGKLEEDKLQVEPKVDNGNPGSPQSWSCQLV